MRLRRISSRSVAVLALALSLGIGAKLALSQQSAQTSNDGDVHVLPVQGNIYMLVGAGANITAQVGEQGILLVDAGTADASPKVLAALKKLIDKPIRYILDTRYADDHTGGNDALRRAGVTITGANVAGNLTDVTQSAAILAHDQVLARMSAPTGEKPPTAPGFWPTLTYLGDEKELYFNGEAVLMMHANGTSDGDSIVFFRRSDVVATGDLFNTTTYPQIDVAKGGSIQGVIEALNVILRIMVPAHEEEGGTLAIPGHGRLCDEADVLEYRDMLAIVRDRIRDGIKKGLTLDQIRAARPTYEYDPLYGANSGRWTTDMFIAAAYNSLVAKK
jgi:glyoxylase-like metal-dependent hydrolase (beta-lactamase superfamily II)